MEIAHHPPTATGLDNRKLGFWTFIGSETLFFGSLISTYMVYKGAAVTGPYPHEVLNIPVTSVSTFVLLTSSLAMVLALNAVQRGSRAGTLTWLLATAIGGLIFLGFQAYEFTTFVHEGLTIQTNVFGSAFYVLTGFHGAHVSVGVLWLLTLAALTAMGKIGREDSLKVEIAGLYWHFVDVVWIVIFTLIYLIP
ncbi:MAG: cytochrome oxidase subunit III [Gemmatimonadetes bacterium]|uniref:Cytochrome bo(3) ubiquinol oxidase subunit 3 n=1 Tax=Candidatus Kutchimonas denitrificans TaxID=3056748 RepID=A0AAE5CDQ5_9BACT|nr:cytochrome oxidase subunit III [Gemmatimonadota bacterium]NIR76274.1 cytochrome oxidase subunit III [Candidatus Kutchimonas denitrificans]NIS02297.1 cytochrome oxidase subunit III [Gemmatimonadota bacterium]NIT68116.1 cytochrome oxidase subunit III [Gemmatimonadota bacterium]NIU54340.1 cytochrome oxidase subunit III [Gemmatimonadota bacterium]